MKRIATIILLFGLIVKAEAKIKKEDIKSNISYVSLQSAGCNGSCPNYKIELYNSGLVRYSGYNSVKDIGVYEAFIGTSMIMSIFHDFEYCQVDTCQANYNTNAEDPSGMHIAFNYKASIYTIKNADLGPKFLKQLANEIDAAVKVDPSWKKVDKKAANN